MPLWGFYVGCAVSCPDTSFCGAPSFGAQGCLPMARLYALAMACQWQDYNAIGYSRPQRSDNSNRPVSWYAIFFFCQFQTVLKYQICQACNAVQMNHWSEVDILMRLTLKCPKWSLKLQPRPASWFNSVLANQYLCMKFLKVIRT